MNFITQLFNISCRPIIHSLTVKEIRYKGDIIEPSPFVFTIIKEIQLKSQIN